VEIAASTLCLARGLIPGHGSRKARPVALVLGAALLSWTAGDIVLTFESLGGATPPTPSLADAFYLFFYPLAYVAVLMFIRGEIRRLSSANWLDGAIAGLGAAAACAAFAFHSILRSTGSDLAGTVTNLAYPIGDVLLLGLIVGAFAALSGRRRTPWILLAAGIGLNVVGDTSNLFQNSLGASRFGVILNAIAWPTAIVVMSMAVWLRQRSSKPLAPQKRGSVWSGFLKIAPPSACSRAWGAILPRGIALANRSRLRSWRFDMRLRRRVRSSEFKVQGSRFNRSTVTPVPMGRIVYRRGAEGAEER
jgi:hypothetical protein